MIYERGAQTHERETLLTNIRGNEREKLQIDMKMALPQTNVTD